MKYVFEEPEEYTFKDRNGHSGKIFLTNSDQSDHLIIECSDKLTVALTQQKSEFNYYVIEGEGYFILNGDKQKVSKGNLIVIPPGTKYNFGGKLKMLLINTPPWSPDQETSEPQPS
jgi:mannose-6-phosphate isomerase-like protein (cupin superfamily)